MRKIIMDVDTGSDDAIAILAAIQSDELDLIGITTVAGNKRLEYTTENTLRVLELAGVKIPVYSGCREPLVCNLLPSRHGDYDGMTGVGEEVGEDGEKLEYHTDELPLPPSHGRAEEEHAVFYLVNTLLHSEEPITLALSGPMTNLAMALRIDARITEHIEEIVFMGGGFKEFNSTAASEFNIWNDPEAAQIVLTCGVPITMVPLDATHKANFTLEDAGELRGWKKPAADFFATMIEKRVAAYNAFQPQELADSAPIHDALALAYLIEPEVLEDVRLMRVDVDISGGFADGQTICDTRTFPDRAPNVHVALGANRDKFTTLMKQLINQY